MGRPRPAPCIRSYRRRDRCQARSGESRTGSGVGDNCNHAVTFRIHYTAHTVTATVQTSVQVSVPTNISAPTVSGADQQGQQLSLAQGSWSNNPTSISDQWQDCDGSGNNCTAIAGATGQTHTLTSSDVGHTIRVQEIASNAGGTSNPANSAPTAIVIPLPPQNNTPPSTSGTAEQNQTLTLTQGSWSNNPTSIRDRWEDCDSWATAAPASPAPPGRPTR